MVDTSICVPESWQHNVMWMRLLMLFLLCYMKILNASPPGFNEKKTQQTKSLTCLHVLLFLSDMSIHNVNVSAAETGRILNEALELRKKRQALLVRDREPDLRLVQPIPFLTYVFIVSLCQKILWSTNSDNCVVLQISLKHWFFFLVKPNQSPPVFSY